MAAKPTEPVASVPTAQAASPDAAPKPPVVVTRLDPNVQLTTRLVGNRTHCMVRHAGSAKYFEMGNEEYVILKLLVKGGDLAALDERARKQGVCWSREDLARFLAILARDRLVIIEDRVDEPKPAYGGASNWFQVTLAWMAWWVKTAGQMFALSLSQRLPLLHADPLATSLHRKIGWFFSPHGFLLWSILVFSGFVLSTVMRGDIAQEFRRLFQEQSWFSLVVIWCISKGFHEAGHAIAAKHQGVHVGKTGLMFFLFAPLAYVDVTDAWKLPGRWQRAAISLGGIYMDLAVASISLWLYYIVEDDYLRHGLAQVFMVTGPATLMVNANPLMRLDGYYVLSDLLDIPNLRLHGRRQLVQGIEWVLFGVPRTHQLLDGWRRPAAMTHALASVGFQVLWMSGLVIAVSTWAKGAGIVLAVAAMMTWGVLPFARWLTKIWCITPSIGQRRRLFSYTLLLITVVQYVATMPSPISRRVPVVARYRGEQVARATADAFVRSVLVHEGQEVDPGMLLVVLDEPELRQRYESKLDELKAAELKVDQLRFQGQLASMAAEQEHVESLRRQSTELAEQVSGLNVVATRRGIVLGRDLDSFVGRFLKKGDEILRVGDPQEMELVISVAEQDVAAFDHACQATELTPVRFRGGVWIQAKPIELRPRAKDSLPHPALASTAGGPLLVEVNPTDSQSVRVVEPRLESITPLDPVASGAIRSGQVGSMSIADDRPMLKRFWEMLHSENQ